MSDATLTAEAISWGVRRKQDLAAPQEMAKLRPNSGWPEFHEQPAGQTLGVAGKTGQGRFYFNAAWRRY